MGEEWKCEKCGGSLWVPAEDGNIGNVVRCDCYPRYMFMQNMKVSGIGKGFRQKTFEKFNTESPVLEKIKCAVMEYADKYMELVEYQNNSLLLLGSVGTGKTHLAVATALQLVDQGVRVKYVGYRDEIMLLKQSVSDGETYSRRIKSLKTCQCLLIDDLFKGKISEADINYCYEIINYRYLEQLPIIVTSEKSVQELMHIDEAIASRMFEMSKGHIITIGNVGNYRLKK